MLKEKTLPLIAVFLAFILIAPFVSTAEIYNNDQDRYEVELEGDYTSFDIEVDEDEFIVKNFYLKLDGEYIEIFRKIVITIDSEDIPQQVQPPSEFTDGFYEYRTSYFKFQVESNEEDFLNIVFFDDDTKSIEYILGPEVELTSLDELSFQLSLSSKHEISISWGSELEYDTVHSETEVSIRFEIDREVTISTGIDIDEDIEPPVRRPHVGRVTVDHQRRFEYKEIRPGLNMIFEKAEPGNIEFSFSSDFTGIETLHIVISREYIGSEIRDLSNLAVEFDGEDIEHMGFKQFYEREQDIGYYVNITDDQAHFFIRLEFSEHSLRIYDEAMIDEIVFSPIGLLLGLLVVATAAVVLFYKK